MKVRGSYSLSLLSINQSLNSIYVNWTNPNGNFNKLTLRYSIIEANTSYEVNLASNSNEYAINSLQPGSSLVISLSGLLNDSIIIASNNLIANTSIKLNSELQLILN